MLRLLFVQLLLCLPSMGRFGNNWNFAQVCRFWHLVWTALC
jgi:hypothetical protein